MASKILKIFTLILWVFAANFCVINKCYAKPLVKKSHHCCDNGQSNQGQDECCKAGKCFSSVKAEKVDLTPFIVLVFNFFTILPLLEVQNDFEANNHLIQVFNLDLIYFRQCISPNAPPFLV